jgi:sulfane dehydrogenase subunit SoxC
MAQDSRRDSNSSTPAKEKLTRRTLLATAAAGLGTAMVRGDAEAAPATATATGTSGDERRLVSDLGKRSPYEKPRRLVGNVLPSSASKTPLQDLDGIITPSDLHYERHHTGVPTIDPDQYTLRVEGLVERPMTFSLQALKELPKRSVIRYLECGNNGIPGFAGMIPQLTPQQVDGMVSTSEWTGTTLAALWDAVRPKAEATWFFVEGHDGGWTGSIPMSDRWDDSLIAWGQNGEAMRPEQGYPARLLLAGHPGGPNIKWISRIELMGGPIPEKTVRDFSSVFGAKSLITYPAYPNVLEQPGMVAVSGLAWSGRGKIARVDISDDGGDSWAAAELRRSRCFQCARRASVLTGTGTAAMHC